MPFILMMLVYVVITFITLDSTDFLVAPFILTYQAVSYAKTYFKIKLPYLR